MRATARNGGVEQYKQTKHWVFTWQKLGALAAMPKVAGAVIDSC